MKKMKLTLTTLAASLVIMTFAAAAQATVLRAFVSSTGNDVNIGANCVQATPCKTFAVAIGAVTAGGELIALDTSGYGPVTINKAITIATVPGATAFVVAATGTAAFTITGAASDLVILRNINFNGSNAPSTTGVQDNSGKLIIEDCKFAQLTTGLAVAGGKAMISNSSFAGNGDGLAVSAAGKATAVSSKFVGNTTRGVYATGANSEIYLDTVQVVYNNIGVRGDNSAAGGQGTNDGGRVLINFCVITDNTTGVDGIASSFAVVPRISGQRFNTIEGNAAGNDCGTITGGSGYSGK